jgi:hypothetical protein
MERSVTLKSHLEGPVLTQAEREEKTKGGGVEKFLDLKVPGHCPLVLLLKLGSSQGKKFENKDGKVTGSGLFAVGL